MWQRWMLAPSLKFVNVRLLHNSPLQEVGVVSDVPWRKKFGKRRRFVVLFSYSGKGYMGLQRNPGLLSIEGDLVAALSKANAIPETDLDKLPVRICSRTDKGVSAARQLYMVKPENATAVINAHLPPQIRVMAVRKVTAGFSRHLCNARTYEYVLPTYAFAPYNQTTADYCISDETVAQLERLLGKFVGTRNYHNFTKQLKFHDPTTKRFISSFQVGSKFVGAHATDPSKRLEFIILRVKGQSFVLHQIRKMVGYVMAIMRGYVEEGEFDKAFEEERVDIPKAPSRGLLLDNVYFDHYNAMYASNGERESLDWSDLEEEVEDFKRKYIYRTIIETELKDMFMMEWLHILRLHYSLTAARIRIAELAKLSGADYNEDPLPDTTIATRTYSPSIHKQ